MSTSPTFIAGYETEVTINLIDYGVVGNVLSLDWAPTVLPKPVFGQKYRNSLNGQIAASLSASGHLSVEIVPSLFALVETEVPVAFEIQIGTADGDTDGGTFAGFLAPSGLGITSDASTEWEWSFDGETDGPITYTAPA